MTDIRLKRKDWVVAAAERDIALRLCRAHHYARGASNTATYIHGIFPADAFWMENCKGVAWWLPPTKPAARAWAGDAWQGVLALSRLVIEPDVPKNAATFLLSRSQKMIDRRRWPVLVTYADEWRGHTGAIYRAANWEYAGMTKPEAVYTRRGVMIARKAGPKTRTHKEMLALGAILEGRFSKHRFVHRAKEAK